MQIEAAEAPETDAAEVAEIDRMITQGRLEAAGEGNVEAEFAAAVQRRQLAEDQLEQMQTEMRPCGRI